jgi:hypothetical protein
MIVFLTCAFPSHVAPPTMKSFHLPLPTSSSYSFPSHALPILIACFPLGVFSFQFLAQHDFWNPASIQHRYNTLSLLSLTLYFLISNSKSVSRKWGSTTTETSLLYSRVVVLVKLYHVVPLLAGFLSHNLQWCCNVSWMCQIWFSTFFGTSSVISHKNAPVCSAMSVRLRIAA